ncbi:MAG: hypothetical protein WCP21_01915 [Armatimonadota bacterium]
MTLFSKPTLAQVRRADVVEANTDLVDALEGVTTTTLSPESLQMLAALNLVWRTMAYYRSVLILQRMADQICYVRPKRDPNERRMWTGSIRFRGFTLEAVALLQAVVHRGMAAKTHFIEAGPAGEKEGTFNYYAPKDDHYVDLPPDMQVDLCVKAETPLPESGTDEDVWIWGAFTGLMSAASEWNPRLLQCHMPTSAGVEGVEVRDGQRRRRRICGTFYIPPRGKATCWRATCEEAHRDHYGYTL